MSRIIAVALGGLAAMPLALGQVTIAPLPHVVMAALNVVAPAADGSLSACSVADNHLYECVQGLDGPLTDIDDVLPCACCTARQPFSESYDDCASYISRSMTHLSSEYTLFTAMHSYCSRAPAGFCRTAGGGGNVPIQSTLVSDVFATLTPSSAPATTTGPSRNEMHPACQSIGQTVLECAEATPELLNSPIRSLAGCFCFSTGASGFSTFAGDVIEDWASSCARWARTEGEFDALTLATPFTTLCDDQTSTGRNLPTKTRPVTDDDDEDDDNGGDRGSLTAASFPSSTSNPPATSSDDTSNNGDAAGNGGNTGNSATVLGVSVVAALAAVFAAVAIM